MRKKQTEDYVEAIYQLIRKSGYARVSDISSMLRVQPPSVTEMLQKLAKENLVIYERYKKVKLTPKGEKLAKEVIKKHETLKEFLRILGVDEKIAEKDACKIEHHVHPETMRRLTKFVEFVKNAPKSPKWLEHFRYFYETGKYPPCKEE
ncbi:transcriptional regulator MntR [Candidatus Geothermarchaeota archaeon]|nr:MAG: transcriptional regulator MntR [Candidatus Geothermarchaeota archaeon]